MASILLLKCDAEAARSGVLTFIEQRRARVRPALSLP